MKTYSIKEAREISGLSQKEASAYLRVPFRSYQDWEYGKRTCKTKDKIISLLLAYKHISKDTMYLYNTDYFTQEDIIKLTKIDVAESLLKGIQIDLPLKEISSDLPESIFEQLTGPALAELILSINENIDYWKIIKSKK